MGVRVIALLVASLLTGCISVDKTSFAPGIGQQVIVRQGSEAVLSHKLASDVIVTPSTRTEATVRPTYVAMIRNNSTSPITFRYSGITVTDADTYKPLKVWTVDQLQAEARGQAIALAIFGGIAGASAGYYSGSYNVNGYNYHYSGYNSAVGSAVSTANVAAATTAGEINVAALEANMLMDNTILPGEAYGGVFEFDAAPVTNAANPRRYIVTIPVGDEVHELHLVVTREKVK